MVIAEIVLSHGGKVNLCHLYNSKYLVQIGLGFVEDITVLLHHVNLSDNFTHILILHFWLF